jgi:ribosomal 50S subunit-recycling heat shock protein
MAVVKKCKDGKEPIGVKGRCVKPKTQKVCKDGKLPIGVNGRCVKPEKVCKDGKLPIGVNNRCVKPKTEKVRGVRQNVSKKATPNIEETASESTPFYRLATTQGLDFDETASNSSFYSMPPSLSPRHKLFGEIRKTKKLKHVSPKKRQQFRDNTKLFNEIKNPKKLKHISPKKRDEPSYLTKTPEILKDSDSNIYYEGYSERKAPLVQNKKNPHLVFKKKGWFGDNPQPKIVETPPSDQEHGWYKF